MSLKINSPELLSSTRSEIFDSQVVGFDKIKALFARQHGEDRQILFAEIHRKISLLDHYSQFLAALQKGPKAWEDPLFHSDAFPYLILKAYQEDQIDISLLISCFLFWGALQDYKGENIYILNLFEENGSPNILAWNIIQAATGEISDPAVLPFESVSPDPWMEREDMEALQERLKEAHPCEKVIFVIPNEWDENTHQTDDEFNEVLTIDAKLDVVGFRFMSRFKDRDNHLIRQIPNLDLLSFQSKTSLGHRMVATSALIQTTFEYLFNEDSLTAYPQFGFSEQKDLMELVKRGFSPKMLPSPWIKTPIIDHLINRKKLSESLHDDFHLCWRAVTGKKNTQLVIKIAEELLKELQKFTFAFDSFDYESESLAGLLDEEFFAFARPRKEDNVEVDIEFVPAFYEMLNFYIESTTFMIEKRGKSSSPFLIALGNVLYTLKDEIEETANRPLNEVPEDMEPLASLLIESCLL